MKQLPQRMEMVLSLCGRAPFAVDVGCDHAYLSIALVDRGIADEAMATDIFAGPLWHAKANIEKEGYSDRISVHQGDGLGSENLRKKLGERNGGILLIAGMGGILMRRILMEALPYLPHFSQLVLQPQSDADRVRTFLAEYGFTIDREDAMHDRAGHYYEAVHAVPGKMSLRDAEALYGPYLIRTGNSALAGHIERQRKINAAIRENLLGRRIRDTSRLIGLDVEEELMKEALRMMPGKTE